MGRAAAVLSGLSLHLTAAGRGRLTACCALVGLLAAYDALHEQLWSASTGWDVAFLALVLLPALFALPALALPLRSSFWLPWACALLAGGAVVADVWEAPSPGAFLKLGAVTALGFLFAGFFESVRWVVGIAVVVPWIDAWSVWRGPTRQLVTHRQELFSSFSIAFPVPGEHAAAALGLPDVLFFAIFLASAARWGLRTRLTWLCLTLSFGATMALAAYTSSFGGAGLPALPLLAVGFLAPNLDLLVQKLIARSSRWPVQAAHSEPQQHPATR